jgi:alanyl aminopeptidase
MKSLAALAAIGAVAVACGQRAAPAPVPEPTPEPAPPQVPTAEAPEGLRLPEHAAPTAYALELEIDPEVDGFAGRVAIDVELREPVSSLWLNGAGLRVRSARVEVGDRHVPATLLDPPGGAELIGLDFGVTVPAGAARLVIEYTGRMGQRAGLFRQEYDGTWYAYTDFEATDARRAFPCFDDPRFKVPWTIALTVEPTDRAFANSPEASADKLDDGRVRIAFRPTRPLPSYLVAFAVGPFEVVQGAREPVPIRAIVFPGTAEHARFALDAAPEMLELLSDYFDAPVPYEKIDFIAVPRFGGAMENPGLITVGARILLLDPDAAGVEDRRLTAMVIAHELAHLWFGDYVTLAWWDDLWLNEGFATWMADKTVAAWKPSWRWELEANESKSDAMEVDSDPSARAIRQPIRTRSDIREAFGAITYKKGGAVLAMFEAWIGEAAFRDGIRAYVRDHADATATSDDLLAALSKAADRDVTTPFHTFLGNPGVPRVKATLDCAGDAPRVVLEQTRHVALGYEAGAGDATWHIPVCVRHPHGRDCALLSEAHGAVPLSSARSCPAWILPNADEAGYFRYVLGGDGLDTLSRQGFDALSSIERAGVVANVRAGMRSGDLDVATALPVLERAARSTDDRVVADAANAIADVRVTLAAPKQRRNYAAYVRKLFGKRARALGFEPARGENDGTAMLRPVLVDFVGDDGDDPKLRRRARALVEAWLSDAGAIDASMVEVAFTLAAYDGNGALFDQLADALASETDDTRRAALLHGLASFADPDLTRRAVELAFAGELPPHDALAMAREILQNPRTRDAGFTLLRDRFAALVKRVPKPVRRFLPLTAAGFCTAERADQVEAMFRKSAGDDRDANRILDIAVDEIRRCDAYRAHHEPGAAAFFR